MEAQRVLRLEKGHFSVGQGTDSLTQGYSTGPIKPDKRDFVDKPELARQGHRAGHPRRAALPPPDATVVPAGMSQIVGGSDRTVRRGTVLDIGSSPGERPVLGAPGTVPQHTAHSERLTAETFATGLVADRVTVIDLTHGGAVIRLTGNQISGILAKVRSPENRAATPFHLPRCERSTGRYPVDSLMYAAGDFGMDIDGFTTPGL